MRRTTRPHRYCSIFQEMYPRHVERCCEKDTHKSHMSVDDSWVLDNNRREVEKEITQKIGGRGTVVRWYEAAGLEIEPELRQIRRMGVVGVDGILQTCCRVSLFQADRGGGGAEWRWPSRQAKEEMVDAA